MKYFIVQNEVIESFYNSAKGLIRFTGICDGPFSTMEDAIQRHIQGRYGNKFSIVCSDTTFNQSSHTQSATTGYASNVEKIISGKVVKNLALLL